MSQSTFDSLLQKYLAGNCTPEEEKIILKWYERLIEQSDLNLSADERNAIETRLWASIRTNTTEAEEEESMSVPGDDQQGRIVPFRRRARWTAAAIVLAIVTGGIYFYMKGRPGENQEHAAVVSAPDAYVQAVNTAKTVSRIVLADSTVILLQPNATLSYPRRFEGAAREVYLSGTAFFQVKHDPAKHFIVYTGDRLAT
ncbi:MAG: FecR family protein, partial [Chitinophaga rupis]